MRHGTGTAMMVVLTLASLGPAAAAAQSRATSRPHASTTTMVSFRTTRGTRLAFDVSPDGRTIVFDLLGQLWLVPLSGGEARAITDAVRDTAEDVDPSFSPDGATILFQGDRPGSRSLWLIDRDSGVPRSAGAARIGYGARATSTWSPDGRAFAYVRLDSLVVRELSPAPGVDLGERAVRIDGVPNVRPASPAWTPDKSALVFVHGGRVWRVPIEGGRAEPVTDSSVVASAPAYARDGRRLAFLAPDSAGRLQVWVRDAHGRARMVTSHDDVAPHRVRWLPNSDTLLYSADGALWRIAADGGTPQEIPFSASVRFERRGSSFRPVSFARPGEKRAVRGFSALALAPDASRIAMIALDSLWVWQPGDTPRAVRKMPSRAYDLAWAPTGDRVVWTGGLAGAEDLFATDVVSGATRRLTQLPGVESKAAWSPDGRNLAFLYAAPGSVAPRVLVHADTTRADAQPGARTADVRDLGELSGAWVEEQSFVWRRDGRALLTYVNPLFDPAPFPARLRLLALDGPPRMLAAAPNAVMFASWVGDSALVYVNGNRLWRATLGSDGVIGAPRPLSDDAALAASAARDGTVLYLSDDGLRLRRPNGRVQRLGWPLAYRPPEAPGALVIRNVRVFDGVDSVLSASRDIIVEQGRIVRIAPSGSIAPHGGMQIDAAGRVAIPGLIDMHAHALFDTRTAGQLYYGVTTVRDVGSPAPWTAAARDAVEAGGRIGARIVMGGFLFYSTAGSGATGFTQQIVQDSGAIDRGMRIALGLGARYVKQRTFEDWSSAVRTIASAHAHSLPVSGHCAHILPLVAAGIDGKEHSGDCFRDFGRIYDDFTSLYAAAGLWVDPTTGFWEPLRQLATDTALLDRRDVSPFVPPATRALYGRPLPASTIERGNRRNAERTAALLAAGVPLVTGTDAGMPQALHWELAALVRAGLTPRQALMAATSVAARVLGADADLGTIAPGKLADLVIVDGNPLEDIADTQRIWRVVQGGRIIDRDALLDAEAQATVADAARCASSPTAGRAVCSHECRSARETGRCQP